MSCGVGCRRGLDLMLLWLWCRWAAVAPIRLLAWEPPYAAGAALEKTKKKKKKKYLYLEIIQMFAEPPSGDIYHKTIRINQEMRKK